MGSCGKQNLSSSQNGPVLAAKAAVLVAVAGLAVTAALEADNIINGVIRDSHRKRKREISVDEFAQPSALLRVLETWLEVVQAQW